MIKLWSSILMISLSLVSQTNGQKANKSLTAPGAKVEKLADGFRFTEGPAADAEGNVYFTDQPSNRIMIWSTDGILSTFMESSGRANGLYFDKKGNLWACADENNELWSISPDKQVTKIPLEFEGNRFNGPNDLWITSSGGVYFTDPYYKRPWWKHTSKPQAKESVYYLHPDHKSLVMLTDELVRPNGLIGTSNEKILYVADPGDKKTYSFKIGKDGTLSEKTLFCEMGSDGMTIDTKGKVYITGRSVFIFDKTGKQVGTIELPESPSNLCFGGKDGKTLFITARTGLYSIRMNVKGVR